MEQKVAFNIPRITRMSKQSLYGKVVFWVFITVFSLQVIFVSLSSLIFVDSKAKLLDHVEILIFAGVLVSLVISAVLIFVIKWVMITQHALMLNRSKADHNTLKELKMAMENSELDIYYQPQVNLSSGQIAGMETLIRWKHYERGFISPAAFIPLAEQSGLIEAIDTWVLKVSCLQTKKWLEQGYNLRVAVNLSAMLFKDSTIVDTVEKVLQETELPPSNLELELTETVMMEDMDNAIKVMQQLRKLGVRISMDDFGTGYSSLSSLDKFPIHTLKIDKTFVHGINQYSDEPNIADSIIEIGHRLNLKILAEGIETEYQKNYFTGLGCDEGQGYLFSEPVPAEEFIEILKNKNL
jgi:EAL domain-containing protein (putative c-di-GMP-specific phosphodiesterase class I)